MYSVRMTSPHKPPHPALVITSLTVAAIAIAAVFWMLASIHWQIIP